MKIFFLVILPLCAFLCGCQQLTLANGKYETSISGREDFAAVYNDLIFIRVREPADDPSVNYYLDWAGEFEIEDNGHIVLKMDKELAREWDFNYDFYRNSNMITVYDLSSKNSYNLRLRPVSSDSKKMQQNSPSHTGFSAYK